MKHTLEKILSYGRTFFDAPPTKIENHSVQLEIDNKMILMSKYVSQRVIELSGKQLEISFIYGGSIKRETNKTTLRIDSFYVPEKQKIAESYFTSTAEATYDANRYFTNQQKRIVAIGHSHASFDVFHSATDYDNYKNLVGTIGVKISHTPSHTIDFTKQYRSISKRLGAIFNITKSENIASPFSYILPSLVFNAAAQNVDSVIATKSYCEDNGKVQTKFSLYDCNLHTYNKQTTLTQDEKKMLDYSIIKVLAYNKIKYNLPKASNQT